MPLQPEDAARLFKDIALEARTLPLPLALTLTLTLFLTLALTLFLTLTPPLSPKP